MQSVALITVILQSWEVSSPGKKDIFPAGFHSLAELIGEDREGGQMSVHNELDLVGCWLFDNVSALVDNDGCKLHSGTCLSNTSNHYS